jgi:hypothetical protein
MDVLFFCEARQINHQPLVIVLVKEQVLLLSKKYACILMYIYLGAEREETLEGMEAVLYDCGALCSEL